MEKIIMDIIKRLGELQIEMFNETHEDTSYYIGFVNEKEDVYVINPFYDTTVRFNVDPIEEYGDEFLNSDFVKLAKKYYNEDKSPITIALDIFNNEVKNNLHKRDI